MTKCHGCGATSKTMNAVWLVGFPHKPDCPWVTAFKHHQEEIAEVVNERREDDAVERMVFHDGQ